ncbi:MAG: NUDIX hydrolase [Pseudomonadota bacterium]
MTSISFCTACGSPTQTVTPDGDTREREVCGTCGIVHYRNPKVVVGAIPVFDGKILLCKRAIEPRYGFWTLPAGFMELGETMAEGAARETWEEACARVSIERLYAVIDVVQAGQVHVFYTATFNGEYAAGEESLDVGLYAPEDIPWPEIAFPSGRFALECYIENGPDAVQTFLHKAERFRP